MLSTKPLLSIVTVSLDAVTTISETLASVAQQRVGFEVEHICVDGGSQDGTRQIIDRAAAVDPRIQRIYEPDGGIFEAMNKGLRLARGAYVQFLNADDYLASAFTLQEALAHVKPDCPDNPDLIVGDVLMGTPGHFGVWRHRKVPRLLGRFKRLGVFPIHQGQFLKTDLLKSVDGFDARLRLAADVTRYYDLESRFELSIRRLDNDVVLMRDGGAANAGIAAMWLGTQEIYGHLATQWGGARAALMACVKTLQSLSELRLGTCPTIKWFDV